MPGWLMVVLALLGLCVLIVLAFVRITRSMR
jgi:hypothetical protein